MTSCTGSQQCCSRVASVPQWTMQYHASHSLLLMLLLYISCSQDLILQNLPTNPVILSCSLGAFFTFLLAAACFGRTPEIRLQTPVFFMFFQSKHEQTTLEILGMTMNDDLADDHGERPRHWTSFEGSTSETSHSSTSCAFWAQRVTKSEVWSRTLWIRRFRIDSS